MLKILLPLAGIAYVLSKMGQGLKKLEYEVTGASVYRVTLPANVELRVGVRFLNASSQSYTVNSVRLNIKEGDDLLGDCYANETFTIAAGTQTTMQFPVNVRTGKVLLRLVPLLLANKPLPVLTVTGFVTAEGVEKSIDDMQVPLAPYDPRRSTAPVTVPAPKPTAKPTTPTPATKPAAKATTTPAKKPAAKPAAKASSKPAAKKATTPAPKKTTTAPAAKKPTTSAPRR